MIPKHSWRFGIDRPSIGEVSHFQYVFGEER